VALRAEAPPKLQQPPTSKLAKEQYNQQMPRAVFNTARQR